MSSYHNSKCKQITKQSSYMPTHQTIRQIVILYDEIISRTLSFLTYRHTVVLCVSFHAVFVCADCCSFVILLNVFLLEIDYSTITVGRHSCTGSCHNSSLKFKLHLLSKTCKTTGTNMVMIITRRFSINMNIISGLTHCIWLGGGHSVICYM